MSNDSVWGDDITLKAAADVYGVKILLITSLKDVPSTLLLPRLIHLSYLAGIHFNSIHLNKGYLFLFRPILCIIHSTHSSTFLAGSSLDTASMGLHSKEKEEENKNNKNGKKNKKELHRHFDS
ncbi:hypothetical protein CARUB_v10025356mg [Capsella rubella]|uniref:Uncharacterized protein n=1 Tax=Capsella rubella TaxID=81985 RepID=R0G134_9BRAS|nr:hypothetical protein CARUB_v10025356mg [Capsella rubella]